VKKVIRTSVGKRYLGVPDDLPTRFVVEDLDLQKKKKTKRTGSRYRVTATAWQLNRK
jgi:hypothetical protein